MKLFLLLIVLVTIFNVSTASLATHTTTLLSPGKISCFKASHIKSVVINAWNYTVLNEDAVESLANANKQFLEFVHISMKPSANGGGEEGVSDSVTMIKQLNASKAQYDFVWVEVNDHSPNHPWTTDFNLNEDLLGSIFYGLESVGIVNYGVFTNIVSWKKLMNNNSGSSNLPLWYASNDDQINFDNFIRFGGWKSPVLKQIRSGGSVCDIPESLLYYPTTSF